MLENHSKGPKHVLTPKRHMYVHPQAQKCVCKIPLPTTGDGGKHKFFKFSKFRIVCLCVHILTVGFKIFSTDVLHPQVLIKHSGHSSCKFQRHFRKLGIWTNLSSRNYSKWPFDQKCQLQPFVPVCEGTYFGTWYHHNPLSGRQRKCEPLWRLIGNV